MTETLASPELRGAPSGPPPLTGGGRTAIRAVLVVAAALLLVGAVGGLSAAAVGLGGTRAMADSKALPPSLRALTIDTGDLPMAVRVTADPQAREPRTDLRFVSSAGVGQHHLEVTAGATEATVTVRGESPEWLQWARAGEITVVLPPDLARRLTLTSIQRVGVLVADADLDRLTARTTNGAVLLRGSARTMELHTRNGAIHTRGPIEVRESFSANTIHGVIEVEFRGVAPRAIEAVTGDGDVVLGLPGRGPYFVTAQAGYQGGSTIDVEQTENADQAVAAVVARSSTGSVSIQDRS
jgi:hypothetical protein